MGKVVFDISIPLDGFMTAADQTADEPMAPTALYLRNVARPISSRPHRRERT